MGCLILGAWNWAFRVKDGHCRRIVGGGWLMDEILWTGDIEYAGVGDVGSGVADLV
jgi:hypothetical protein